MYSYDVYGDYGLSSTGGLIGTILAMGAVFWIISAVVSVIIIISLWRIFTKNGKAGWIVLIPFYNMWTFFEICDIHGWMIFIPFANIIFMYVALYRIAIKMGRSGGFGVLCIFFPEIFLPILAFSKGNVAPAPLNNYQQPMNYNPQPAQPTPQATPQQPVNVPGAITPQEVQSDVVNVTPAEPTPDVNATVIMPAPAEAQPQQPVQEVTPVAPVQEAAPVETLDAAQPAALQNDGSKFCVNCGNKCASNMKFCDNCGKEF